MPPPNKKTKASALNAEIGRGRVAEEREAAERVAEEREAAERVAEETYAAMRPIALINTPLYNTVENFYNGILPAFSKLTKEEKMHPDAAPVKKALALGVTAETEYRCLQDWVACTSVGTEMPCCATCGRRRLPDIVCSAGGKRTALAPLQAVALSTAVEAHPWLKLSRGKCTACVARGVAAPCTHDFVQCEERGLEVPWPPPAQRPAAEAEEEAPGPAANNHWGTSTGWYLGIPAHFRGGFPVVEYATRRGAPWHAPQAYPLRPPQPKSVRASSL